MEKLDELKVEFVVVDDTDFDERIAKDLSRANRSNIPVNIIYPPNYPAEPAILLDGLIGPTQALQVLARMEEVSQPGNRVAELTHSPQP